MELKPCPFCGGKPDIKDNFIICSNCGCKLSSEKNWNMRVLDDNIEYNAELVQAVETSYGKHRLSDREYDYLHNLNKFYKKGSKKYIITPELKVIEIENEHCGFICDVLGIQMNNHMNETQFDFAEFFIIYALFLGYIRVNIFNEQIAIQYEVVNKDIIQVLFEHLHKLFKNRKCLVVIEKLSENNSLMFDNLSDAYEYFLTIK